MVKLEDAVIARYEHSGHKFEILVDPDLAFDLKQGKEVNIDLMLAAEQIFKDAHKGEAQSPETLSKAFGTSDVKSVVRQIISKGELQLTTDQRRELKEKRRLEIIQKIAQNAINPQTQAPHPAARIETALEEIRFNVDPFKSANEQLPAILKEMKKILPISMENLSVAVRIPAQFSGKAQSELRFFDLKKTEWQNDGSLICLIEIPAGMKNDLISKVNKLCQGQGDVKIVGSTSLSIEKK